MDLQAAMSKLKKTTVKDSSGPNPAEAIRLAKQEAETFQKMIAVNMERWYPVLKEFTFASQWIPVTKPLATALIKAHKAFMSSFSGSFEHLDAICQDSELQAFQEQINSLIQSWGKDGAFVRLSTRSPKYSPLALKKSRVYLEQRLKEIEQETKDETDPRVAQNLKQIALFTAKLKGLKVDSGIEALHLLITSERIHDDLGLALKNDAEGSSPFDLNFIVREWIQIPTHMEFRAFVAKCEMTAFLQDWDHLYFKEFEGGFFDQIALQCKEYFEKYIRDPLREHLQLTDYVIDFALLDGKLFVIELNPFGEGTGAAPFDWHNPAEREIIYNGPFTTKKVDHLPEVTTTSTDNIASMLEVALKK